MSTKATFLEPKFVEVEVCGKAEKFYAISVGTLFTLKAIGKPLAKALTSLFTSSKQDTGSVMREFTDPATGERGNETVIDAIAPSLAELRFKQRQGAVGDAIDALFEDKNREVIAEVIMDSMRDVFERPLTTDSKAEFIDDPNLDVGTLLELLRGVARANKGLFGPLGKQLSDQMAEKMREKMAVLKKGAVEDEEKDEVSP